MRRSHPRKASRPVMEVTDGKRAAVRLSQFMKARSPTVATEGRWMLLKPAPLKAFASTLVAAGASKRFSQEQPMKQFGGIAPAWVGKEIPSSERIESSSRLSLIAWRWYGAMELPSMTITRTAARSTPGKSEAARSGRVTRARNDGPSVRTLAWRT